jgi:hypothetical protein
MTRQDVIDAYGEEHPGLLFLDPAETYDQAIVGVAVDYWGRLPEGAAVVYDAARCVAGLVRGGMTEDDAAEWFAFNTTGAFVGPYTPLFVEVSA